MGLRKVPIGEPQLLDLGAAQLYDLAAHTKTKVNDSIQTACTNGPILHEEPERRYSLPFLEEPPEVRVLLKQAREFG
jgi:hypothetical protein